MFEFTSFPVLSTIRLTMNEIRPDDLDGVFAIFGDSETCRFFVEQDCKPYSSRDEARIHVIDWAARRFADKAGLRWAIRLSGQPELIGTAGYNYWDRKDHRAEIGYDLVRAQWRKGLMTEAVYAMLTFGFEQMGLHRIEANVTEGNQASVRVLEKCGFRLEGTWRDRHLCDGNYYDLMQFGLLRHEFTG